MSEKLKGKIVSVAATKTEAGKYMDTVIITYEKGDQTIYGDFCSPQLKAENIRLWRKIMLKAILGRQAINDDMVANVFKDYKASIYKKNIYVVPDEKYIDIVGIGKDQDNIFYPDAYGLFAGDDDENDSEEI